MSPRPRTTRQHSFNEQRPKKKKPRAKPKALGSTPAPQQAPSYSNEDFARDVNAALEDPNADYSWIDELPDDPRVPTQPGDVVVEFRPRRSSGQRRGSRR